jgi:hypothetical protein
VRGDQDPAGAIGVLNDGFYALQPESVGVLGGHRAHAVGVPRLARLRESPRGDGLPACQQRQYLRAQIVASWL